jgi:hypothetical protein
MMLSDPTLMLTALGVQVCWAPTLGKDALWFSEHKLVILDARLSRDDLILVVQSVAEKVAPVSDVPAQR